MDRERTQETGEAQQVLRGHMHRRLYEDSKPLRMEDRQ